MEQNGLRGDSKFVLSGDKDHDCDELIERKDLGKVVNRERGAKQRKERKERKTWSLKTFHRLRITSPIHTHATVLENGHLRYQVWP